MILVFREKYPIQGFTVEQTPRFDQFTFQSLSRPTLKTKLYPWVIPSSFPTVRRAMLDPDYRFQPLRSKTSPCLTPSQTAHHSQTLTLNVSTYLASDFCSNTPLFTFLKPQLPTSAPVRIPALCLPQSKPISTYLHLLLHFRATLTLQQLQQAGYRHEYKAPSEENPISLPCLKRARKKEVASNSTSRRSSRPCLFRLKSNQQGSPHAGRRPSITGRCELAQSNIRGVRSPGSERQPRLQHPSRRHAQSRRQPSI